MRLHVSILSRGDRRDIDATMTSVSGDAVETSVTVDDPGVDDRATHVLLLNAGVVVRPGALEDLGGLVEAAPKIPLTFRVDRIERHLDRYRAASMDWSGLVFDLRPPAPEAEPSSVARILELGPDRAIVPVGSEALRPFDRIRRTFEWIRHYDRACLVAPHDVPRAGRPPVFRQHWSPAFEESEDALAWAFEMAPGPTPFADNLVELLDVAGHHSRSDARTGDGR